MNYLVFYKQVVKKIITDLEILPEGFLRGKNISGYPADIRIKISSRYELICKINIVGNSLLMKKVGNIDPGQIVKYANNESILYVADTLSAGEEFDLAIEEYRKLIKLTKDSELLKSAWNNMGLCY